jgi:hypothetical protein
LICIGQHHKSTEAVASNEAAATAAAVAAAATLHSVSSNLQVIYLGESIIANELLSKTKVAAYG